MEDPILNRRFEKVRELIARWNEFHEYLNAAMKGAQFDAAAEQAFLALKSRIAILHDAFMDSIDKSERGVAATAQNVISVVESCINLRRISRMDVAEAKKLELEWHECFLLLNETLANVQEKIDLLANTTQMEAMRQNFVKNVIPRIQRFVTSPKTIWALVGIGVLFAIFIGPAMGLYTFDFLDKGTGKPIYRGVRSFSRSVFGGMGYLDYEEYNTLFKKTTVPGNIQVKNFDANEEPSTKERMLKKNYPGMDPFDLSQTLQGVPDSDIKVSKYNADSKVMYVLVAICKNKAQAEAAEKAMNDWRGKISPGSTAEMVENNYYFVRKGNLYGMIYCENKGNSETMQKLLQFEKLK
jgi:hypothetical protein